MSETESRFSPDVRQHKNVQALRSGQEYTRAAIYHLAARSSSLFEEYWGVGTTPDRPWRNAMILRFEHILIGLNTVAYQYEFVAPPNLYLSPYHHVCAWVCKYCVGPNIVHVTDEFYSQPLSTLGAILVHEISHRQLLTNDYGFGVGGIQRLSPDQRLDNADCYGLFARACARPT